MKSAALLLLSFVLTEQQLIDALYRKDELLLEYDAVVTRAAAQAFEARSGNCLALVMMTSAFAREIGLSVRCQSVPGDDSWDRSGDVVVSVGHVNLTLSDRPPQNGIGLFDTGQLTIDFVAPRTDRALRTRVIAAGRRARARQHHGEVEPRVGVARPRPPPRSRRAGAPARAA